MADERLQEEVVRVLAAQDIAGRYYNYCDRHHARGRWRQYGPEDVRTALEPFTPLPLKYHRRERFFSIDEAYADVRIGLNIAFSHSTLELILLFTIASEHGGGILHGIARRAGLLAEPPLDHQPPYPRLPFGDRDELRDAARFAFDLYREIKEALLTHTWGDQVDVS
jgi:hypothetical protein